MEPIPYPGCYQCPRCHGREMYMGEKTLSATAITVNTSGPVDPTFVTANKIDVHRCTNCNTEGDYIYHPRKLAEMKQQRIKRLKIAGVALVVILALAGLNFGANKIKGAVSTSRAESKEKNAVQQVEAEYKKWVSAAAPCNFSDEVGKSTIAGGYPDDMSVYVSHFIEPAGDLAKFWKSDQGMAFDCLSSKLIGVQMSTYLSYPPSEISTLKEFDSLRLYDEKFTNGTEKGALGKMRKYQGYISYSPAGSTKKNDTFFLYFNWQLAPVK